MTTNKKNQKGHSESLPQRMERLIGSVKKRKVNEAADLVFDAEAMIAWDILQTAWKKHKEAQVWVIGQCARKKA